MDNSPRKERTPEQKAKWAAYMREYWKKNPDKRKAMEAKKRESGAYKRAHQRKMDDPEKHQKLIEYARKQHEKFWDKKADQRIAKRYGVTFEEIAEMRTRPCEICGDYIPRTRKRGKNGAMAIDHCHATGKLRGVLCGHCNTGIGLFKDSTDLLLKAINYLNTKEN